MINIIWLLMLLAAWAAAVYQGDIGLFTDGVFAGARQAVELVIDLAGVMMLWMGILALLSESGLLSRMSAVFKPVFRLIFPTLPPESRAFEYIAMNFCANLLGLGNAATPFGLQAIAELQKENPQPDTATDNMITLLLLNTSAVSILPTTVIALRSAAGAVSPAEIVPCCVAASAVGLAVGLMAQAILRRVYGLWEGGR